MRTSNLSSLELHRLGTYYLKNHSSLNTVEYPFEETLVQDFGLLVYCIPLIKECITNEMLKKITHAILFSPKLYQMFSGNYSGIPHFRNYSKNPFIRNPVLEISLFCFLCKGAMSRNSLKSFVYQYIRDFLQNIFCSRFQLFCNSFFHFCCK